MNVKPYDIRRQHGKWCVVNAESGETVAGGCHPSRAEAEAHLQALYANVEDASLNAPSPDQEKTKDVHKTVPFFLLKAEEKGALGVVDAIVSVMGIIDLGDDIIHKGAYLKTIQERAGKIRVLDNHQTQSVRNAIGRPLLLREVGRNDLPQELRDQYPDASGGLFTSTQFMLDDEDSYAVYKRLREQFINEFSIGFDIIKNDFGKAVHSERGEIVVRNLRELKLYEYSPVLWGMNQATALLDAKGEGQSEGERTVITIRKGQAPDHYQSTVETAAQRCASCRFYKTMDAGTGHCERFDFIAARTMVCNDFEPGEANDKSGRKEMTPEGPQPRLGDQLKANVYDTYMTLCNSYYKQGYLADFEHRQMCDTGMKMLDVVAAGMTEDIAMRPMMGSMGLDWLFFSAGGGDERKAMLRQLALTLQAKSGRVLSSRNETRLQEAVDIIMGILAEVRKESDASSTGTDEQAEPPDDQALTDTDAKRLELELRLLEAELEG